MMGFPLWGYMPNSIVPSRKGLGEDFAGVVEEAGSATGFQPGAEVFGIIPFVPRGTLQTSIRISTKDSVVLAKPADWS